MKDYGEAEIAGALSDVANGVSVKKAALEWGIPRSTLRDRLNGAQTHQEAAASYQRLPPGQEASLAKWVLAQADLGLAPTHRQVREFASRILAVNKDPKPLGKHWLDGFLRRYPALKVQRSVLIDSTRVNGATTEIIRPWFRHLALPDVSNIKPANRWNMDEAGVVQGLGENGLVLGHAAKRSILKKKPESRAWISFIECISADGRSLPPLVIFQGKSVQQQWFPTNLNNFEGWKFTATDKGWTDDDTALEWLKEVFLPLTKPADAEERRLLVVDGHGSHTTTDFMWNCYINNVHILFLPPHSSHVLQPLDLSVFSPLKRAYKKRLGDVAEWNDSTAVGKRNFVLCFQKARVDALVAKNIKAGWLATGLWPVRPSKPLLSPLLLENNNKNKSQAANDISTTSVNGLATPIGLQADSEVVFSTPSKPQDVHRLFATFETSEQSDRTRRLLFQKIYKGFSQQAFEKAISERKVESLTKEVEARRPTKKRRVEIDPNTKFASIWDIKSAQLMAQLDENRLIGIPDPETPRIPVDGHVVDNLGGEEGG